MKLFYHGPESAVEDPDTLDPVTWRWRTRLADLIAVVRVEGDAFIAKVILPKEIIEEAFESPEEAFDFVRTLLSERGEIRPRRRL
jgi:hypothetical protein